MTTEWPTRHALHMPGIPFEVDWGSSGLRGAAAAYTPLVIRMAGVDASGTLAALRRRWEGLNTGAHVGSDEDGAQSTRQSMGADNVNVRYALSAIPAP